jgi:hypothetical protein
MVLVIWKPRTCCFEEGPCTRWTRPTAGRRLLRFGRVG